MEKTTVPGDTEATDAPAAPYPMKRRGLIAAAAALVASAAASNTVAAYAEPFNGPGLRVIRTGYSSVLDDRTDAIQGFTGGADNSGVLGRNDSNNGVGVTGVATNGFGVLGQSSGGPGVQGVSRYRYGVHGKSDESFAVLGSSTTNTGVVGESFGTTSASRGMYGKSTNASGVEGRSEGRTGVYGSSTVGNGVYGFSTSAVGIAAYSRDNNGMQGNSPNGAGVAGASTQQAGVRGSSEYSYGVTGETRGTPASGVAGVYGTGSSIGVFGQSATSQGVVGSSAMSTGVYGTSTGQYGVWGLSSGSHGIVATTSAANFSALYCYRIGGTPFAATFAGPVVVSEAGDRHGIQSSAQQAGTAGICGIGVPGGYAGYFAGDVVVSGNLVVGGGGKSAAVPHPDGSTRLLYCVESPESWFEDYGDGTLAAGTAAITLDPDFTAVADTTNYRVFVSAYGDSKGLYVAGRTPAGFTVREQGGGTSATAFSWRVVAKRKDIKGERLAKTDITKPMAITATARSAARPAAPVAPPMVPVPMLPKAPVVEPPIMPGPSDDGPAQPPTPGAAPMTAANTPATTNATPAPAPARR